MTLQMEMANERYPFEKFLQTKDISRQLFMKSKKSQWIVMGLAFAMAACSGNDDNGGNGEVRPTVSEGANTNGNIVISGGNQYVGRLEFPRTKGGNSVVVTHTTDDAYGVNYSYEWDTEKMSQRWTCYQMYKGYDGNGNKVTRYEGHSGSGTLIANYDGDEQYPRDPLLHDMTEPKGNYYFDSDYFYGSGFDHGHICPSADRLYSKEANKQTFYLTNMQPQYHVFNAGLWEKMENKVRALTPTNATDTLYVCKGGTIDDSENILQKVQGKLIVPKYFFMALLLKSGQSYKSMAFWAKNEKVDRSDDNLTKYVIPVDELEQKTGIDFFCNLPDSIEDEVEAKATLMQ